MVQCWAPDCKHYSNREKCSFFRLPTDSKIRAKWLKQLRRETLPGPGTRICSCHFRDGKKENGPELFKHNIKKKMDFPHLPLRQKTEQTEQRTFTVMQSNDDPLEGTSKDFMATTTKHPDDLIENLIEEGDTKVESETTPVSVEEAGTAQFTALQEAEMYFLKKELEEKDKKLKYVTSRFTFQHVEDDDVLIRFYTGVPSKKLFMSLFNLIKNIEINYIYKWTPQKISKIDQLFLTLIKLRLNFPHIDLAQRFNISVATVSNIVITHIYFLKEILYDQMMSTIPSKEKNMTCLPSSFSTFTNCRIVLDCTEIVTIKSRKSPKVQSLTYSSYKHCNTWKALVGVAPNGVITYISSLFPGSTSDKKIVKKCGILDQLQNGDLVIADKGFLISDILPYGVTLNIPPFLTLPQFTTEQVKQTETIARCRVHVERAIRRLRVPHFTFLATKLLPFCRKYS